MDLQQFEDMTLAWGPELARWPAARRDAARVVIAAQPDATLALIEAARRLDTALRLSVVPAPSASLRARIAAAAPRVRRVADLAPWRSWFGAAAGAALAVSCAAGVLTGVEAASHGLSPANALSAPDPAADAAQLLRGSTDQVEG
jgi:hypothetical protein